MKYPLLRRNGKLERVSWEEALSTMVETLPHGVQSKYGPGALGVLSTGQLVTEEFYTLGKLYTCNWASARATTTATRHCALAATAVSGYKLSFGSDGPLRVITKTWNARMSCCSSAANLADNHPILCQYLENNPNKTLIVADPRVTKTAMMADLHLPLKPRSDLALINGISHILIRYNIIDRD